MLTQYLSANADSEDERYQSRYGIYTPACALSNVLMTWGHDENLYHVLKDYLPEQALYIIRFHSCYPVHTGGNYGHLMHENDKTLLPWVNTFNQYDLYSKSKVPPNVDELRPYYQDLISKFLPDTIRW